MNSTRLTWADPAGPWAPGVSSSGQDCSRSKVTGPLWARVRSRRPGEHRCCPLLQPEAPTAPILSSPPSGPPTVRPPPAAGSSSESALWQATANSLVAVKRKQVPQLMEMSCLSSSSKSKEHKKDFGSPGERQTVTEQVEERDKKFRKVVAGPLLGTHSHCTSAPRYGLSEHTPQLSPSGLSPGARGHGLGQVKPSPCPQRAEKQGRRETVSEQRHKSLPRIT